MSDIFLENFTKKDSELIYDKNFVQSVFKKVERITGASFYIVDKIEDNNTVKDSPIKSEIYNVTFKTLNIASDMLQCTISTVRRPIVHITSELAHLSALLTIAATSDRIPTSHAMLIQHEIDALVEVLDHVRSRDIEAKQRPIPRSARRAYGSYQTEAIATEPGEQGASIAQKTQPPAPGRKERIKDILREKGQIGIKDISDIITDVSEKSIQRDLNDLILSGVIVRLGERRWSTYKLS